MQFEALQARYGDCLLLTFAASTGERPNRLLVDGGPAGVFRTSLEPRLQAERKDHPEENPLLIDAVMVSHIDEDHVLGVLDLFGALQDAEQRQAPWLCKPRWLLHNSFDALAGEGEGGAARSLSGPTVLASFGGALKVPDAKELHSSALRVLQSYAQGSKLSTLAAALKIGRNPPNQHPLMLGESAAADGKKKTAKLRPAVLKIGGASVSILGPLGPEISDLREKWAAWRAKQKEGGDERAGKASLAAYLDKSVPNLSSIVALVEQSGKKVLLTGDARGDKVLEGLKKAGLRPDAKPFKVDILKLPHHGSVRNLKDDFFQFIHADHYVASGDGTYGNPDRETLEMLERARPEGGYTLHLTYPAEDCDATHEAWLQTMGGKPFKAGKDSIADVVARWRKDKKIKVQEGPVTIRL